MIANTAQTSIDNFCDTKVNLDLSDWYFIFILYLYPNMLLGFFNQNWLYLGFIDHRLLEALLPLPLLFFRHDKIINRIPGLKSLGLICIYVIFQIFRSLYIDIPVKEIASVIRWNIVWPIPAFCIVYAASAKSYPKLGRIFHILISFFMLQTVLGLTSALLNVDFFINKRTDDSYIAALQTDAGIRGNTLAFPKHYFSFSAIVLLLGILIPKSKWLLASLIVTLLPICMTKRMPSAVIIIELLLILSLASVYIKQINVFRILKILAILLFISFTILFFSPSLQDKLLHKALPNVESKELKLQDYGTYSFRLRLLEDSILVNRIDDCSFFGHGYTRDTVGYFRYKYSYVLGEDTPIAAVIYCEGWSGVFIRLLPCIAILIFAFNNIKHNNMHRKILAIIIIAAIISQVPAYIQSMIITRYDYIYSIFAILYLYVIKDEMYQVSSLKGVKCNVNK